MTTQITEERGFKPFALLRYLLFTGVAESECPDNNEPPLAPENDEHDVITITPITHAKGEDKERKKIRDRFDTASFHYSYPSNFSLGKKVEIRSKESSIERKFSRII